MIRLQRAVPSTGRDVRANQTVLRYPGDDQSQAKLAASAERGALNWVRISRLSEPDEHGNAVVWQGRMPDGTFSGFSIHWSRDR
jgi:hypothetical protein